MKQFGRQYQLDIGNKQQGITLNNLRVYFEIKKTSDSKPNPAKIKIWNFNEENRRRITSGEFNLVKLFAGYDDLRMLYAGDIIQTKVVRDGLDIIMELICGDGDVDYKKSFISTSLAAGATDQQVVNSAAQTMINVVSSTIGLNNIKPLPRGKVLHGSSKDLLNRVAVNNNANWSIQDGRFLFLPEKQIINTELIVLSQETGMIGSPSPDSNGVKVNCLLNPLVKIGGIVKIESIIESYNDIYKIKDIEHIGDALGGKWLTILTLQPGQFLVVKEEK